MGLLIVGGSFSMASTDTHDLEKCKSEGNWNCRGSVVSKQARFLLFFCWVVQPISEAASPRPCLGLRELRERGYAAPRFQSRHTPRDGSVPQAALLTFKCVLLLIVQLVSRVLMRINGYVCMRCNVPSPPPRKSPPIHRMLILALQRSEGLK